jgi:hypothetical protein
MSLACYSKGGFSLGDVSRDAILHGCEMLLRAIESFPSRVAGLCIATCLQWASRMNHSIVGFQCIGNFLGLRVDDLLDFAFR